MRFLLLTTALLLASCAEADASADLTACGVDDAERERLMALSVEDFDQDSNGGWRDVSKRDGCEGAAVALLRDYIDIHDLNPEEDTVVFWHVGQLLAGEGDYEAAKVYFEQSHNADAEDVHERAWSAYAQARLPSSTVTAQGWTPLSRSCRATSTSPTQSTLPKWNAPNASRA